MSSFTRRLTLKMRRKISDVENPFYRAPRDGATRKKVGQPFRRVHYVGKPEDVDNAVGFHYTKGGRAASPAPGAEARLHVPWHLLTIPAHAGKKGTHTRVQRKLAQAR